MRADGVCCCYSSLHGCDCNQTSCHTVADENIAMPGSHKRQEDIVIDRPFIVLRVALRHGQGHIDHRSKELNTNSCIWKADCMWQSLSMCVWVSTLFMLVSALNSTWSWYQLSMAATATWNSSASAASRSFWPHRLAHVWHAVCALLPPDKTSTVYNAVKCTSTLPRTASIKCNTWCDSMAAHGGLEPRV